MLAPEHRGRGAISSVGVKPGGREQDDGGLCCRERQLTTWKHWHRQHPLNVHGARLSVSGTYFPGKLWTQHAHPRLRQPRQRCWALSNAFPRFVQTRDERDVGLLREKRSQIYFHTESWLRAPRLHPQRTPHHAETSARAGP